MTERQETFKDIHGVIWTVIASDEFDLIKIVDDSETKEVIIPRYTMGWIAKFILREKPYDR